MVKSNNTNVFTLSENAKLEYSCTIVQIGQVEPIEGSDFLGKTLVNGNPIVVRKDMIKEGDVMVYAPIETVLNKNFLGINNLFEIGERDKNANFKEVAQLIEEGKKDEAKRKVGFFNKHGRVKLIRLRGCPSMGFLMEKESLVKWMPSLKDVNFEEFINTDFDTINNKLFVKAYVPFIPQEKRRGKNKRLDKRIKKFDRMVEGEFAFHYDTSQFQRNLDKFKPSDKVVISIKVHGTSMIVANILTKIPIRLSFGDTFMKKKMAKEMKRLKKWNPTRYHDKAKKNLMISNLKKKEIKEYKIDYDNVYSSRTVIKNKYINQHAQDGFYNSDIWGEYNELLKPYIPKGFTIYGEIYGYLTGSQKMIQKDYDYGCQEGENAVMIYRITSTNEDRTKKEWEAEDVHYWVKALLKNHPELIGKVIPLPILYNGTLQDLYPDLDIRNDWQVNLLKRLSEDREHFGMEELEPLCKKKVPREGICIRKVNDPISECFKLKTLRFREREMKQIDAGEVDIEMADAYSAEAEETEE